MCVIRQMVDQGSGHIVNITTSIVDRPSSERPSDGTALLDGTCVITPPLRPDRSLETRR
jgi:hypothetical protein